MQQIVLGTRQSASNAGRLWLQLRGGLGPSDEDAAIAAIKRGFDQAMRCSIALRSLVFVLQRGCSREPATVITSSSPPKGAPTRRQRHHARRRSELDRPGRRRQTARTMD
jgi:hypothetical protein